ncbi:Transcription factor mbp1 [Coniosporium apollinis]|uniref:Transcription factor mbp1 n=1 Tax=Coniosporium apollinis TaxID=61459 RepID=A0ABQ9NRH4_9PEZI|nr:Transcription factor mbp1 [Coniosporium apollinis]
MASGSGRYGVQGQTPSSVRHMTVPQDAGLISEKHHDRMNLRRPSPNPPIPPAHLNLDRAIDEKCYNAMHWATPIGDVSVVRNLLARCARINIVANSLDTPLMRVIMCMNNFDKETISLASGAWKLGGEQHRGMVLMISPISDAYG